MIELTDKENKEVLVKIVKIAENNGYLVPTTLLYALEYGEYFNGYLEFTIECNSYYHINEVIFDHEFAKAFWEKYIIQVYPKEKWDKLDICWLHDCEENLLTIWQYHLRKMVLEKEPLKYLDKFL